MILLLIESFILDAGNQMNNLGISIKERYKEICGLECSKYSETK